MATALAQESHSPDILNEGTAGEETILPVPEGTGADATHGLTEGVEAHGGEEAVFPPFDAAYWPSHLFWLAISFGLLYVLVNRLIVPRVGGLLADRADRITSDLGEAARLSRETDEVIAAYEAELAEARQNANRIANARRDEIKAEQARQQADTEAALAARIAKAEGEIAARRDRALADVDSIATDAARAIVERLSGLTIAEAEVADAVARTTGARRAAE